jgi:hypothetical protein
LEMRNGDGYCVDGWHLNWLLEREDIDLLFLLASSFYRGWNQHRQREKTLPARSYNYCNHPVCLLMWSLVLQPHSNWRLGYIHSFLFLVVWGFELRASCLLDRHSNTWATLPAVFILKWHYSWPSISVSSACGDSTNCRLKIFEPPLDNLDKYYLVMVYNF